MWGRRLVEGRNGFICSRTYRKGNNRRPLVAKAPINNVDGCQSPSRRLVLLVDWCARKARLGKSDHNALPLLVPEGLPFYYIVATPTIISDAHHRKNDKHNQIPPSYKLLHFCPNRYGRFRLHSLYDADLRRRRQRATLRADGHLSILVVVRDSENMTLPSLTSLRIMGSHVGVFRFFIARQLFAV